MSQSHQFRVQSSAPTSPDAGVVTVYANPSGVLVSKNSDGVIRQVGGFYTTNLGMVAGAVATGFGVFQGSTGFVYGSTGTHTATEVLGAPAFWLTVSGPSGQNLAIPAYNYS